MASTSDDRQEITTENNRESVDIRPGVSILSVLRHLNYKPWYALAEFVDNSVQSYVDHYNRLSEIEGNDFGLRVSIEISKTDQRITVRDNAAGIHEEDYGRAFRPAEIPPDRTGLSEFGMGMKSAACWFAPRWEVRTSALGEAVEKTIRFDVEEIVEDSLEELEVRSRAVPEDQHFTEIRLLDVHKLPRGKTIAKIKNHLADIYRFYTRKDELTLVYNGEKLLYHPPKVLEAPYYKNPSGESKTWRKEIKFDFGGGLKAEGFAALRETGSTSKAGFSLFRRNRVIEGSGDQGYRPSEIFGRSNSYVYQRLFGEIHLEGFDVSHTKDGFQWGENEQPFLELLKEELESEPLPLISQARGFRKRRRTSKFEKKAEEAAENTAESIRKKASKVTEELEGQDPPDKVSEPLADSDEVVAHRVVETHLQGVRWEITVELTNDPAIRNWLEFYGDHSEEPGEEPRQVKIRMSLSSSFMQRFGGANCENIEPLLRVAAAVALAEKAAYASGVRGANTVRRNINKLLDKGFSEQT